MVIGLNKNKPKTSVPIGTKEISCGTPFYSTRVIWVLTVLVWSYMIFYIHMLEFKLLMTLTNVSLAKDSYRSVVGLICTMYKGLKMPFGLMGNQPIPVK